MSSWIEAKRAEILAAEIPPEELLGALVLQREQRRQFYKCGKNYLTMEQLHAQLDWLQVARAPCGAQQQQASSSTTTTTTNLHNHNPKPEATTEKQKAENEKEQKRNDETTTKPKEETEEAETNSTRTSSQQLDVVGRMAVAKLDITRLECDALVNAANEGLLGGGGVDHAVHSAAGALLQRECAQLPLLAPGAACVTHGYRLPASAVVHAVAPYLDRHGAMQPALLRRCYRAIFALCAQHRFASIAIPSIGTGICYSLKL